MMDTPDELVEELRHEIDRLRTQVRCMEREVGAIARVGVGLREELTQVLLDHMTALEAALRGAFSDDPPIDPSEPIG